MSITLDTINSDSQNIEIQNAAGQALSIDGSGFLTISNTSFAVTATDLDIRDLDSAQDNIEIQTAAGQALDIDASGYITANQGTSPWVVSATDLDIRDLVFATDKVDVSGSSISTTPEAFDVWQTSTTTATNTAGEVAGTPLSGRLRLQMQNLGSQDIYYGEDNTVTTSTGTLLPKGASVNEDFGPTANIFVITASGTADLRVSEYAA